MGRGFAGVCEIERDCGLFGACDGREVGWDCGLFGACDGRVLCRRCSAYYGSTVEWGWAGVGMGIGSLLEDGRKAACTARHAGPGGESRGGGREGR